MNSNKKRLIIVTNFFPPVKYIGSNRMEAFAEFLSEDFDVTVIAEHPKLKSEIYFDHVQVFYFPGNPILDKLKHFPSDSKLVHLFKTASNVLAQKLLKSPLSYWKKRALKKLNQLHEQQPFDLILTSSPFQESHEVAISFCSKHPNVKWICDIRDELSTNPYIQEDQARVLKYKRLETEINNYAFLVSSVSTPILETFKLTFPKVEHFLEIKNGFNHTLHFPDKSELNENATLKIGHFGKFYGVHKPDVFLNAVVEMVQEDPSFKLDIRFYGSHRNFHVPNEIKSLITFYDHLDYSEAIREMNRMDGLLLLIPKFNSKGIYSGKIFDYVSARTPILSIIDPVGVAADLIQKTNSGYVVDYDDRTAIKLAIRTLIEDTGKGVYKIASQSDVNRLHRKEDVQLLKRFLLQLYSDKTDSKQDAHE